MFQWLENTAIAAWVSTSLWGYPMMLAMHVIGLACVAGIFILLDLGLLGVVQGLRPSALRSAFRIGWFGLILNLASGAALFSSQATTFVHNVPFLLKMSLIVIGVLFTAHVHLQVMRQGKYLHDTAGINIRLPAVASLLCWLSAIVAGRLIAYF